MNHKHLTVKRNMVRAVWCVLAFVVVVGWWFGHRPFSGPQLASSFTAAGALLGLYGVFLMLTQLVLVSGTQWLEPLYGHDFLTRIHAVNGKIAFGFIALHPSLIVLGRNGVSFANIRTDYPALVFSNGYYTAAFIAFWLLVMVIVTSVWKVKKRLPYQWWHGIHFATYAVVLLAALHQFEFGTTVNQLLYGIFWATLYVVAFASVLWPKVAELLTLRKGLQVQAVDYTNNVTTIKVIATKGELPIFKPGQFTYWRFWQRGFTHESHPFTYSAAPNGEHIQLSAKAVGDYSKKLPQLIKGTKVSVRPSLGRFGEALTAKQRLFIAGGIGITPIHAMVMANAHPDDTVVHVVQTSSDTTFADTFKASTVNYLPYITNEEDGYITGKRIITAAKLRPQAIEVWLCGPPLMMDSLELQLIELGVEPEHIHTERFAL